MTDLKEQKGEGKKDKMEISYFLDRQFMCLLEGGGHKQRKECEISSGCSSAVRV